MQRVRVILTGFPGGPGLMTFYAVDGAALIGPLSTMMNKLAPSIPLDVSWNIPADGDIVDPISGQATGGWSGGTPTPGKGLEIGSYAAPVGVLIRWETGQIRRGRKVRGRTFIVPLAGGQFQNDGSIATSQLAVFQEAASSFVVAVAPGLLVFQRPQKATNAWTDVHGKIHAARPARVGEAVAVTTAVVPDKSVVLRSRRD